MYTCTDHGDNCIVVYESKFAPYKCPVCQALEDLEADKAITERNRDKLDDVNTDLEREVDELKAEIERLRKGTDDGL